MADQAAPDLTAILERSDQLYKEKKWTEAGELLAGYHNSEDPAVMWRVIRALYRQSKYHAKNGREAEELARKALDISKKSLKIDPNNFQCVKWGGIILSHHSALVGQKEKIASAVQVKEHFEKAIEIDPNDMAVKHLLGRWHFNVASVPWYVRSAARVIYSNPPSSTYQEALALFQEAEALNKIEFFENWLFLAKTHYQLGNKAEAKTWATKVVELAGNSPDLVEAKQECTQLLKKL